MGVWMIGAGVLKVDPEPDDNLIAQYVKFSQTTNPYKEMDEFFPNTWFWDEDNNLKSIDGKFAEPSVWLKYIKTFLQERGYEIIGDPMIIGETDRRYDIIRKKRYSEYMIWKERMAAISEKM